MKVNKYIKKLNKLKHNNKLLVIIAVIIVFAGSGSVYAFTKKIEDKQESDIVSVSNDIVSVEEVVEDQTESEAIEPSLPEPVSAPANPPEAEVSQWPVTYTQSQAASLTVVVNKKHKLPSTYAPSLKTVSGGNLRPEAADALALLLSAASDAGVSMRIISSYRSYNTQVNTYQKWVSIDGQAQADRSSARPGHSEHQTGLAVDLGTPDASCDLLICFGSTAQGKWLAANAHNYGYIVRYESDTEAVTGYQYEPWHMRYLGVEVATAVKNSGRTLDQYYGVEAGGY